MYAALNSLISSQENWWMCSHSNDLKLDWMQQGACWEPSGWKPPGTSGVPASLPAAGQGAPHLLCSDCGECGSPPGPCSCWPPLLAFTKPTSCRQLRAAQWVIMQEATAVLCHPCPGNDLKRRKAIFPLPWSTSNLVELLFQRRSSCSLPI